MKKISLLFLFSCFITSAFAKQVITLEFLKDKNLVISTPTDYHLTSKDAPFVNTTIDLAHEDAWLYFDNIRPATVVSNYADKIKINGVSLNNKTNAHVMIYKQGAVVIPHASSFKPFRAYTADNYLGDTLELGIGINNNLGAFNNNIRSFVLKRGYMATIANESTGLGYSRVFVADDADIEMPIAPGVFYAKASYIRVFRWNYVSKKGWCTTSSGYDWQAGQTESTWVYTWSADKSTTLNCEYSVIKQHLWWPSWDQITNKNDVTHLLSYNEPEHSEQHDNTQCSCGGVISADRAVAQWPEHMKTGMRLGSPSPTDMSWLYDFVDKIDAKGYRLDYVAIHCYWGTNEAANPQAWYNQLKTIYDRTKRPIWITEWNNGANWTTESWPSDGNAARQKQLTDLKGILHVLDTASFVERYSIYNWVEDKRRMLWDDGWPTPAGFYYKGNQPTFGYAKNREYIPTISTSTPSMSVKYENDSMRFTITDNNGEMTDRYIIQLKTDDLYTEYVTLAERVYDKGTNSYTFAVAAPNAPNGTFRLKHEYCNGSVNYSAEIPFASGNNTNQLSSGDYYILNANTHNFLTQTSSTTPTFKAHTPADSAAQVWTVSYDAEVERYKITSKGNNNFLNESAQFGTATFYNTWNTYNLHGAGLNKYAIQNGGKAGTHYWTTTSTTITGKGSTSLSNFPFKLIMAGTTNIFPSYSKNTLQEGFYYIINTEDSTYLTNDGTNTPKFRKAKYDDTQKFQITLDPSVGRYILTSNLDGKYMNENGAFATYAYSAGLHTFNIYHAEGTSNYVVQNSPTANNPLYYWKISGATIAGAGTTAIIGLPFILTPAPSSLTVHASTKVGSGSATKTSAVEVATGSTVTLIAQGSIANSTYLWSTGETTNELTLTNIQQSGTYTVTCTHNNLVTTHSFTVNVYAKNQLTNGDYFIKNPKDGSFLTVGSRELGPQFTGRNVFDRNTQLWTITKDGVSGRYSIVNKKNSSIVLNEFGLYTSNYYPAWNSYELYNLAGTKQYAIQNGGSSGTRYWQILSDVILGKGASARSEYPFELSTFEEEEAPEFDAFTYIQTNTNVAELTDSMVVAQGTKVTITYQATVPYPVFSWSNGANTESIVFESIQENQDLIVNCVYGTDTLTHRFVVMVYAQVDLEAGTYFIQNTETDRYLTVSSLVTPSFSVRNEAKTENQLWLISQEPTTNRYQIASVGNGKYLANDGKVSTTFDADNDTYYLYKLLDTERYAVQNAESAGNNFWQVASNRITTDTNKPTFVFSFTKHEASNLQQTHIKNLQVITNPVLNYLQFSAAERTTLTLTTLNGQQVGLWNCENGLNSIAVQHLTAGIYIATFRTEQAEQHIKIIKIK